jgi:hypothetical protein
MRLTMTERKKATAVVAARYQKARKKEKRIILDEFIKLTGYGRRYASYVLRCQGGEVRINKSYVIQGDIRKAGKRKKPKVYDSAVEEALKKIKSIISKYSHPQS